MEMNLAYPGDRGAERFSEPLVEVPGLADADPSLEELGLAPTLSRLSQETLELIKYGVRGEHRSQDEVRVEVCAGMSRAGYGTDEIWTVMTDPANGIYKGFYEEEGEEAETRLEQIISKAHTAAGRAKSDRG